MMDDGIYFYSDIKINDSFINKIRRVLSSAVLFVAAFIVSNIVLQSALALLASSLGYTVELSYNLMDVMPKDYRAWNRLRVMAVYLMGPVICVVLGIILFTLLMSNHKTVKAYRLFFFWVMVCLVNISLGQLFFSPLGNYEVHSSFYQTFAIVGTWFGFTSAVQCIFSVIAILLSVLWGVVISGELWRFSFSSRLIRTQKGKNIITIQFYVIPIIVGAPALAFLTTGANLFPLVFTVLNLMFIAVGMFVRNMNDHSTVMCNKDDVLNHIPVIELLFTGAIWYAVYKFF